MKIVYISTEGGTSKIELQPTVGCKAFLIKQIECIQNLVAPFSTRFTHEKTLQLNFSKVVKV